VARWRIQESIPISLLAPVMITLERLLDVCWALIATMSVSVVLYRKILALSFASRMRWWHKRPDLERLCERSLLFVGIVSTAWSVTALYVHLVVTPALDRTLTLMRGVVQQDAKPISDHRIARGRAI
jgi:hypothetical protein